MARFGVGAAEGGHITYQNGRVWFGGAELKFCENFRLLFATRSDCCAKQSVHNFFATTAHVVAKTAQFDWGAPPVTNQSCGDARGLHAQCLVLFVVCVPHNTPQCAHLSMKSHESLTFEVSWPSMLMFAAYALLGNRHVRCKPSVRPVAPKTHQM